MSTVLFAENRLALEPLIRSRLSAVMPDIHVGGLIEYMELLDGAETSLPAAFVYLDGDAPGNGTGSPHQITGVQTWVVATVAPIVRDAQGRADMAPTGILLARVVNTLSGERLAAGLKPMAWTDSHLKERGGLLFAYDVFTQPFDWR